MKAQTRSRYIQLYSLFNLGYRWEWVVNAMSQALYPQERPSTILLEVVWAPGLVWMGQKISPLPGLDTRSVQSIAS
jgi:hypothetical protein